MIVDEGGQVEYCSPAVERLTGFGVDEIEGSDAFEYVHPDDRAVAADAFESLITHPGEQRTIEYRMRHADGSWRWIEVRGRNLLDDPVIAGFLVNVRDITQRKAREQELQGDENGGESGSDGRPEQV